MTALEPTGAQKRREDVLVSLCFGELIAESTTADLLVALARQISARFRFWEMIVVIDSVAEADYHDLLHQIENLRLVCVREGTGHYRKRVVAAEEAIGDLIFLATAEDLPALDALGMIETAGEQNHVVRVGGELTGMNAVMALPMRALGRGAGFRVGMGDLQSLAFPRTLLNRVLTYPDAELALRFLPHDNGLPITMLPASDVPIRKAGSKGFRQRLGLVQTLLVNLAPRMLAYVALSSALLMILGAGYAIYVLGAWAVLPVLEPGWLTVSLMLSLTATFLGFAILGLSIGLQQILRYQRSTLGEDIVGDVGRVDLFGQVARDLNVEVALEPDRESSREQTKPHA